MNKFLLYQLFLIAVTITAIASMAGALFGWRVPDIIALPSIFVAMYCGLDYAKNREK